MLVATLNLRFDSRLTEACGDEQSLKSHLRDPELRTDVTIGRCYGKGVAYGANGLCAKGDGPATGYCRGDQTMADPDFTPWEDMM